MMFVYFFLSHRGLPEATVAPLLEQLSAVDSNTVLVFKYPFSCS